MANHDRIVIGASAGGVEALQELVSHLPRDLQAAVFIVLHIPAWSRSELPSILSRSGDLPAFHPKDGDRIENGRIYIAPPNRHLLIANGHIHLSSGPKESRSRPAVNVLFRSAALAYESRVVGVVLTGALDDGTAGLWEIKRRGGIAIVQAPEDALYPDMPQSAVENVLVDYSVPVREIPALLASLANEAADSRSSEEDHPMETIPTQFTCPECRGPIREIRNGALMKLNCRVGHSYSPESFLAAYAETRERTLWSAIVALEEGGAAARELAPRVSPTMRARVEKEADETDKAALKIRSVLTELLKADATTLEA